MDDQPDGMTFSGDLVLAEPASPHFYISPVLPRMVVREKPATYDVTPTKVEPFTRGSNALLARIPDVTIAVTLVTLVVVRQTTGWRRTWAEISNADLMQMTGLSESSISRATRYALEHQMIQREPYTGKDGKQHYRYASGYNADDAFTKIPNFILDALPRLENGVVRLLLAILRESVGWQYDWVVLAAKRLCALSGMRREDCLAALKIALGSGLVERRRDEIDARRMMYRIGNADAFKSHIKGAITVVKSGTQSSPTVVKSGTQSGQDTVVKSGTLSADKGESTVPLLTTQTQDTVPLLTTGSVPLLTTQPDTPCSPESSHTHARAVFERNKSKEKQLTAKEKTDLFFSDQSNDETATATAMSAVSDAVGQGEYQTATMRNGIPAKSDDLSPDFPAIQTPVQTQSKQIENPRETGKKPMQAVKVGRKDAKQYEKDAVDPEIEQARREMFAAMNPAARNISAPGSKVRRDELSVGAAWVGRELRNLVELAAMEDVDVKTLNILTDLLGDFTETKRLIDMGDKEMIDTKKAAIKLINMGYKTPQAFTDLHKRFSTDKRWNWKGRVILNDLTAFASAEAARREAAQPTAAEPYDITKEPWYQEVPLPDGTVWTPMYEYDVPPTAEGLESLREFERMANELRSVRIEKQ